MQDTLQVTERVRKSARLSPEMHSAFKRKVKAFDTKIDAAEYFGFSTVTLDAVLLKGRGKPSTIETIINKVNA